MFRNRRRPRISRVAVAGAAALLAVGIAACSSSGSSAGTGSSSPSAAATGAKVTGGTATVALPPGVTPNWIFPYTPLTNASEYNSEGFYQLMYRPLYMFGNDGTSVDVNYPLSPAAAPVYTDGGKTVTITMKNWKWSNGEAVDAKDVIFFLNMYKAEPDNFYGYVPGLLPDNLASYSATGADTVVLHLKAAVSSIWFTYNQLAELTPMPMAWDVTSATAKAGSGGCTTDSAADKWAKCAAVYNFLTAQAKNAKTYATNPIWAIVDGPYKLASYNTGSSGAVTSFTPNPTYSGSPKSALSKVTYEAYTDDSTEYTALKTGQVDVGYIPTQDLSAVSGSQVLPSTNPLGSAYTLGTAYAFGIQYININLNNPTLGAAYSQLYVRQAMQEMIDQEGMVKSVDRGYGYPTSGTVPVEPTSQWVSPVLKENGGQGPYAFNVANGMKLLTSHGWKEVGGVMTCESPGTAATDCGAGVKSGTALSMTMDYATGVQSFQEEVAIMKSDFTEGGIKLNLVPQSFNTIIGDSSPCKATQSSCTWDMLNYGGWNFNGPGYEPTGEPLYATGAGSNSGSYSNPEMDSLINATHTSSSLATFQQYATYSAEQLPGVLFDPSPYTVTATTAKLANVANNPLFTFLPEYWNFTK